MLLNQQERVLGDKFYSKWDWGEFWKHFSLLIKLKKVNSFYPKKAFFSPQCSCNFYSLLEYGMIERRIRGFFSVIINYVTDSLHTCWMTVTAGSRCEVGLQLLDFFGGEKRIMVAKKKKYFVFFCTFLLITLPLKSVFKYIFL